MPLASDLVGFESKPYVAEVDDRWAMNYAAGIDDPNPALYDTRQPVLPVHPMYLAHPEWEAMKLLMPHLGLTPQEASTSVEMSHDTAMSQPLVAGLTLSTTAVISGIQRHRAGALISFLLTTREERGNEIGATTVRALYRGVDVAGEDRPAPALTYDGVDLLEEQATVNMPIPATACHTYSECARIWNPIHTDSKVAEDAGLPGLILHGTATIARAMSALCEQVPSMNIANITRISADLRAMVLAPSATVLHFSEPRDNDNDTSTVSFRLVTDGGGQALTRGAITYTQNNS